MLLSFASSSALACTGSETCSMPCCRSSANDASRHDCGAGSPNCCDPPGAGDTACSLAGKEFVFSHGPHVGFSAALSAIAAPEALQDHVRSWQAGCTEEKLPLKRPRYLQIHVLLI
jgi:hypothetical protein